MVSYINEHPFLVAVDSIKSYKAQINDPLDLFVPGFVLILYFVLQLQNPNISEPRPPEFFFNCIVSCLAFLYYFFLLLHTPYNHNPKWLPSKPSICVIILLSQLPIQIQPHTSLNVTPFHIWSRYLQYDFI